MKSIRTKKKIAFRQAQLAVIIALILGLLFSAIQIAFDFKNELVRIDTNIYQFLNTVRSSAAQAAYGLEDDLAERVISGLFENKAIVRAKISTDIGVTMGAADRSNTVIKEYSILSEIVLGDEKSYAIDLYAEKLTDPIGQLIVWVNLHVIYEEFFDRIAIILILGLFRSLILAALLTTAFYFLLTKRLLKIIDKVNSGSSNISDNSQQTNRPETYQDELTALSSLFDIYSLKQTGHLKELTQSEEKLRTSEQRFRIFAESSSDWFWETDTEGRVKWISETSTETPGIALDNIRNKTREEIAGRFFNKTNWMPYTNAIKNREDIKGFVYEFETAKGMLVTVEISGKPIFDNNGNFLGYQGVSRDITRRCKLEEQVRRSQKMDAVGQLTGGIAHDFNNILGIIQGSVELLGEVAKDDRPQKLLKTAQKGIDRGTSITKKLLSFSRKDSRQISAISVNDTISDLKGLIERSLTVYIDVETRLEDEIWGIAIDPGDFEDALLNLSLNARDAMPEGGTLRIETYNKVLDEEYVQQHPNIQPGDYVLVSIIDTGLGMDAETQEKIFEPFFTTKELGKGTGLGLAMVYGFIQRSGGHIRIYSEIDKGTTFQMFFPRTEDIGQTETVTTPEYSRILPTGTETILIVDDEDALRDIAADYLEDLGYQTLKVKNGDKAWQIIQQRNQIDLLLSDVVMPGQIDGYQLAEKVHGKWPSMKIQLTSGFTTRPKDVYEKMNGFQRNLYMNILAKPYTKTELSHAIRKILDGNE
ncbi:hypothetical protein A9Q83_09025 [Alphaproteobacteria bacterium 46_93_T64]|nr:hypothetical protein A9Q83_09025 [Alphaproteobacteria bacterium 46_93_T64]